VIATLSNLLRTLRTMEGYGLVRLECGERGRITPKVMHDRAELDLPLTLSRRQAEQWTLGREQAAPPPALAAGVKPATPGVRSSDLKWRRESLPSNNLPSARSIYETVKVVDPSKDS